jgi:hypothetical protein
VDDFVWIHLVLHSFIKAFEDPANRQGNPKFDDVPVLPMHYLEIEISIRQLLVTQPIDGTLNIMQIILDPEQCQGV